MIASDGTFSMALTFWQLFFRIFGYIVSIALLFVTLFAEVSIAPTEPLGY